jgi:hypothetical protein
MPQLCLITTSFTNKKYTPIYTFDTIISIKVRFEYLIIRVFRYHEIFTVVRVIATSVEKNVGHIMWVLPSQVINSFDTYEL